MWSWSMRLVVIEVAAEEKLWLFICWRRHQSDPSQPYHNHFDRCHHNHIHFVRCIFLLYMLCPLLISLLDVFGVCFVVSSSLTCIFLHCIVCSVEGWVPIVGHYGFEGFLPELKRSLQYFFTDPIRPAENLSRSLSGAPYSIRKSKHGPSPHIYH